MWSCLHSIQFSHPLFHSFSTAGDDAEAETEGSPPRFEVRTWSAIPEFGKLTIQAVEQESARLESVRQSARDEASEDGPAEGGDLADEEDAGGAASSQDGSLTTLVTTAHRQFIKARDLQYKEYREYFFERMMHTAEDYDALLQEEHAWAGNWSTMVEFLKKDEDAESDDE